MTFLTSKCPQLSLTGTGDYLLPHLIIEHKEFKNGKPTHITGPSTGRATPALGDLRGPGLLRCNFETREQPLVKLDRFGTFLAYPTDQSLSYNEIQRR